MKETDIKKQIVDAIKTRHSEEIEKGQPVINTYEGVHKLLPHLDPKEINIALAKMNSVKIIDSLGGSLEFFPDFF
ncbi:MAG: hypothetical protein JST87_12245 [Bacteroidetes bacterium]|nr:hypothetical protein [Bacteroidota bacterium]